MRGDTILVEEHHRRAAADLLPTLLDKIAKSGERHTVSVAGESGSGKSETATAVADCLEAQGIKCVILQQDDYFVHPPKTNDKTRRQDISWVGPQEVKLALMDEHLAAFLASAGPVEKPLVIYEEDKITSERMEFGDARVVITEGTYTSLLENTGTRIFIARDFLETRAHREKRKRDESELDPFIDKVLKIEHGIISEHRARADIVIESDYSVSLPD